MKKVLFMTVTILCLSLTMTSCRDKSEKDDVETTESEKVIQEMREEGAKIEVNEDVSKIKMETENREVKIKTDDEGDVKIKEKIENDDN